jgi:hypothetical protein
LAILESNPIVFINISGSSYEDAFKLSTDPVWQEAWNDRIKDYLDDYRGMGDTLISIPMNNPSIALYDNFYATSAFPEYEKCEVIAIPAKYDFKPYAYGFQKDSPYLGIFNHFLKEMREKGSLKKIQNKFNSPPQICPDSSGQPLGFDNCFTAFTAWLAGIGLGLVLLCLEFISRMTGLNLSIFEMYDRRDPEDQDPENYDNILDNKNAIIHSLSLQVKLLERKLKKSERHRSWMLN